MESPFKYFMDDEFELIVEGGVLSRGASETEELIYCLNDVPSIISQAYDTSGGQAWLITIG